jgi:two-component system NtrC family sensor kinase
MRHWFVLLVLIGLSPHSPLLAQTRLADSLQTLLSTQPRADTLRVRRLLALSRAVMMTDLPRAVAAAEQSLALSRRLADAKGEGAALIRLGTLYRQQNDFDKARRCTQQALGVFTRLADLKGLATVYLQLSFIENAQSNLKAALQAALRGLTYADKAHDPLNQVRLGMLIGSNYVQLGNYKEAVPMLRRILGMAQELKDDQAVIAVLTLLGTASQELGQWSQALSYFEQSARLSRIIGDLRSATGNEVSEAELYARQENYAQALVHGRRARQLARTSNDAFNLPPAELAMARAYLHLGQVDSARVLARHGYRLSLASHSKENLRNASEVLAKAYAREGQYAEAYRYQSLWAAYKDSIAGEETQRATAALRYGYELDKKQDQIALLTQSRELQAQRAFRQRQEMRALLAGVGGLLLLLGLLARNIFLKQRANRSLNEKNEEIALQRDRLDQALTKLKTTQTQLVQSEKMVALAALTSGVAHEMQNPLNFVNNFAEVSLELLNELEEEHQQGNPDAGLTTELLADLRQNLLKINQHGDRASGIVKGMLEHAHADPGQCQPVNLNNMAQEYLRLAYHALQTKHHNFEVARSFDLDPALGPLKVVPQELGRVLLNLFTNAFYAVHEKAALLGPDYVPSVRVRTRRVGGAVELHVRDNGPGIPAGVMDKIFDPFFTTKPPGEGTGLGLWLTYDIVTKGYGGTLTARSEIGAFTEFIVTLPQDQSVPVAASELAEAEGE